MRMILAAALIAIAAPVHAASPFDGTWIWDASATELPAKPDVYKLDQSRFRCVSCPSPYEVAADGKPHPVAGQNGFDAAAVSTISPPVASCRMKPSSSSTGLRHGAFSKVRIVSW